MNPENFLISHEAEQSVLGALLLVPEAFDRITVPLAPEHFANAAHREIFRAIAKAHADGKPCDIMSIAFALDDAGLGQQTGGLAYLGEMTNNVPGASAIANYAQIVFDKARMRAMRAAIGDMEGLFGSVLSVDDLAAEAQAMLQNACETGNRKQPESAKVWADAALQAMERRISGQDTALPTGFADLDAMLSGGLNPGNLVFVAARPGMGKTSFALQVAQNAARSGKTALFCSMEMSGVEVSYRQQAELANVPLPLLISGDMTDYQRGQVDYAIQQLANMPLYIDDQGGLTFADVAMKARQVKRRAGKLDLVVVDYLQLMHAKGENRNAEIERISRALKGMAKELEIPVIVLSQLNREVEKRPNKRPILADLRDSGAIEQDADVVLMLYRDEVYDENSLDANTAEILIRKHRQGKIGDVRLAWHGETASFGYLNQFAWRRNRDQAAALRKEAKEAEKKAQKKEVFE